MPLLRDEDQIAIQQSLDRLRAGLSSIGLELQVECDLADWARHMENAPEITAVSPSFDPRYSHLHPGNSFWVSVREADSTIAACACHRLFLTGDLRNLIASHKLFFDKKPVLDFRPVTIVLPPDAPQIAGRIAYGGGYWVHPRYRGVGLTEYVPRISRFLSLRYFEPDWNVALLRNTERRRTMARDGFGVTHQMPCIDGYYPPDGGSASYQLAFMSADEMMRQVYADKERPYRALSRPANGRAAAEDQMNAPQLTRAPELGAATI